VVIVIPDPRLSEGEFGAEALSLPYQPLPCWKGFPAWWCNHYEGHKRHTWINGDFNSTHGILLTNSEGGGGEELFAAQSIPYQNGTTYAFEEEGEYTYEDPVTDKVAR
jgi:hypothetical protein